MTMTIIDDGNTSRMEIVNLTMTLSCTFASFSPDDGSIEASATENFEWGLKFSTIMKNEIVQLFSNSAHNFRLIFF